MTNVCIHMFLFYSLQVTSLKFEKTNVEDKLKHNQEKVKSLEKSSAKKGESLERFQQKLGQIRVAMTKEVDKVRHPFVITVCLRV